MPRILKKKFDKFESLIDSSFRFLGDDMLLPLELVFFRYFAITVP